MFKKTLDSSTKHDRAFGAVVRFACRTMAAGALSATLVVAFVAPLGVSATQARAVASAATHTTLTIIPMGGCGGTPLPC